MKRLGILISGRGSNFEAIANNIAAGKLDAEIAVVLSNRAAAAGLDIARARGLNAECIPSKAWTARSTTECWWNRSSGIASTWFAWPDSCAC